EAALEPDALTALMYRYLTEDRVFGRIASFEIEDFYDSSRVQALRQSIASVEQGIVLVIGFGASMITQGDVVVYADLARWEIQLRYRSGEIGNWRANNREEEQLRKYKRGFFVEWRTADRL